jgi:hypothetical protein
VAAVDFGQRRAGVEQLLEVAPMGQPVLAPEVGPVDLVGLRGPPRRAHQDLELLPVRGRR